LQFNVGVYQTDSAALSLTGEAMRGFSFNRIICVVTLLYGLPAHAIDYFNVKDAQGKDFIELRFFSTSDIAYDGDEDDPIRSTWNLSAIQKERLIDGVSYWGNIIKRSANGAKAIFNIGTIDDLNAYAYSPMDLDLLPSNTYVQMRLLSSYNSLYNNAHAVISIGKLPWNDAPLASQIPTELNGMHLSATAAHEIAHALGITSSAFEGSDTAGVYAPYFAETLNAWSAGLRDDNGNAAKADQEIWCSGCSNPATSDYFDLRNDRGYFTGTHVNDVLAGAMSGVPVKILSVNGGVDDNYMSHIELKNSMMSHQNYRNYVAFMEAELAVMQDLGYDIDRRNFFGSSIYGNGLTVINNNGYFRRNGSGTAYQANTYNPTQLGLGLHIYGSNNTVTQRADLLSSGSGGAGIRIDGEGNALTIGSGTRVHANGINGRGVMFTYGKNHTFTHLGDIQATGTNGIAASFDFGNNMVINAIDYRGSYIHYVENVQVATLPELDGPLVTRFDVSGSLTGKYASIFMSANAYVRNINIMQGAKLAGDIISEYSQKDSNNAQRLTNLSFGYQKDSNGVSNGVVDADFKFRFDGNITGIDNLHVQMLGGHTTLNGDHTLYSMLVAENAILAGKSTYELNTAGTFVNHGTILADAGNSFSINGSYTQSSTGTLKVTVNGNRQLRTLSINGDAILDGSLIIELEGGWFSNGFNFTTDQWVTANNISGAFDTLHINALSPTLTITKDTSLPNGQHGIIITRQAGAYSSFAQDGNDKNVGRAIDHLASTSTSLRPLLSAMDFSSMDGSDIHAAFDQLTPAAYNEMYTASLLREHQITNTLMTAWQGMSPESSAQWEVFAVPFTSGFSHDQHHHVTTGSGNITGIVFGAERREGDSFKIGAHGALSSSSATLTQEIKGKGASTAISGGLQLRFEPNPYSGLYALGTARLGVEMNKLDRTIIVSHYDSKLAGTWNNLVTNMTASGGWRWQTGQRSSIGAIAGVDYTMIKRPALTESGAGEALKLDQNTFNSFRVRLGGEWRSTLKTSSGHEFATHLQTSWHRNLLNNALKQTAHFVNDPDGSFDTSHDVIGANSLDIQAGVAYGIRQNMKLNGSLAATMWTGGGKSFTGAVSVNWQF
jgi:subtilase-type serine protease